MEKFRDDSKGIKSNTRIKLKVLREYEEVWDCYVWIDHLLLYNWECWLLISDQFHYMLLTVIVTFYSLFIYLTQHIPNSLSHIIMPKSKIRIICLISNDEITQSTQYFMDRLEKLYVLHHDFSFYFNLLTCGFLNFIF
jgi:hypothetical protein